MTASEWAGWIGAVTGVVALGWEFVKWFREGPRLLLQTSPSMRLAPDNDSRFILMVWVTNQGTAMTTLTSFGLVMFDSRWRRWRWKSAQNWVVLENVVGPSLPVPLMPGQQWLGGVRQTEELRAAIASDRLYVAIYHTLAKRGELAHVSAAALKQAAQGVQR